MAKKNSKTEAGSGVKRKGVFTPSDLSQYANNLRKIAARIDGQVASLEDMGIDRACNRRGNQVR